MKIPTGLIMLVVSGASALLAGCQSEASIAVEKILQKTLVYSQARSEVQSVTCGKPVRTLDGLNQICEVRYNDDFEYGPIQVRISANPKLIMGFETSYDLESPNFFEPRGRRVLSFVSFDSWDQAEMSADDVASYVSHAVEAAAREAMAQKPQAYQRAQQRAHNRRSYHI